MSDVILNEKNELISRAIKTSKFIRIFVEFCTFIKKVTKFYKISIKILLPHIISNSANFFLDIEKNQINISKVSPKSPNIEWYDQNLLFL